MRYWFLMLMAAIAFTLSWKVALGMFMFGIISVLVDIRDLLKDEMIK